MRAVAVGMAASEGMPVCPRDCGGVIGGAYPGLLTATQHAFREANGCDADAAHALYTITCPKCDGSRILADGVVCDYCEERGALRGERKICRCPASHMTPEISDAVRHYQHSEGGAFPVAGGLLNQSPTYIQFVNIMGGEIAKVQRDEAEERRAEARNKSNARNT